MTRSTLQRLRLLALVVAASAATGGLYSTTQVPAELGWAVRITTGATIGAVMSSCIVGFELFGAGRIVELRGRQLPLAAAMLIRTIVYGLVIMTPLVIFPWLISDAELSPFRRGMFADVLSSAAATFVMVALTSIIQLIGPNVLGNLLTGRYYHPREEHRIVLFLDLADSTSIAERIGNVRFHALLSETFTRLARVVTDLGGEVHRFVGDALIATWPIGTPKENARPLRSLFACRDALWAARTEFLARHGRVPGFRAGLHAGPLVAGEIGGFKREITFIGDAMNTAARIEQACRATGYSLLASKPLLDRARVPAGIVVTSIGFHLLRGKSERLELFVLESGTQNRVNRDASIARTSSEGVPAEATAAVVARSLTPRCRAAAAHACGQIL